MRAFLPEGKTLPLWAIIYHNKERVKSNMVHKKGLLTRIRLRLQRHNIMMSCIPESFQEEKRSYIFDKDVAVEIEEARGMSAKKSSQEHSYVPAT